MIFSELEKRLPKSNHSFIDVFVTSEANEYEEPEVKKSDDSSSSSSDEDPTFHLVLAKQKLVNELRNLGLRADSNYSSGSEIKSWISRHT